MRTEKSETVEKMVDDLNGLLKKFEEEHPDFTDSLDLFGITMDQYMGILAETRPTSVVASSTNVDYDLD